MSQLQIKNTIILDSERPSSEQNAESGQTGQPARNKGFHKTNDINDLIFFTPSSVKVI